MSDLSEADNILARQTHEKLVQYEKQRTQDQIKGRRSKNIQNANRYASQYIHSEKVLSALNDYFTNRCHELFSEVRVKLICETLNKMDNDDIRVKSINYSITSNNHDIYDISIWNTKKSKTVSYSNKIDVPVDTIDSDLQNFLNDLSGGNK